MKNKALLLAAMISSSACAGQQAKPETAQQEKVCDPEDPKNQKLISDDPGKTVYEICGETFVMHTLRGMAATTLRGSAQTQIRGIEEAEKAVVAAETDRERTEVATEAAQKVLDAVGVDVEERVGEEDLSGESKVAREKPDQEASEAHQD